jgi:bla regulator protein BlaR1
MTLEAVLAHLWQSTLVAAAIALVALVCRRADAQTRYWIWFAASLKFVIPFAALTSLGARLERSEALPSTPLEWTLAIEAVSQPILSPPTSIPLAGTAGDAGVEAATVATVIWFLGCAVILGIWLLRWRRVSRTASAGTPIESGRVFEALNRLAPSTPLPIVASDASLEPGVFGLFHPVLLWPSDIDRRFDEAQVQAILAHELAHVRRRDNLTAAVHMLVEVIFWFHPLVWWIGSRLVDERERACDQEVVRRGNDPHVYAESILRTCQFYVETPLSCVPGVTGADLKKRIERIMADRPRAGVRTWSRTLLLIGVAMTLAAPVVVGALGATTLSSPIDTTVYVGHFFDAATVRPNTTGGIRVSMLIQPDGTWEATNVTLESMIRMTYRLQESQLVGGPAWIYTDRFDIHAKMAAGGPIADFSPRMQALLAERFQLKVHNETRDLPIYSLVTARSDGRLGPQLMPAAVDCTALARTRSGPAPALRRQPNERPPCGTTIKMGRMTGGGVSMQQMAQTLAQFTGRMVIDRTGLSGNFDYDLDFAPDPALRGRGLGGARRPVPQPERTSPLDPERPSIFTAVHDQLGLRLDAQRAAVAVVVVDAADRPTGN